MLRLSLLATLCLLTSGNLPRETCDILVIGNGVAGSVAHMAARDACGGTKRVCSVAKSASSTTTRAVAGTFFWPPRLSVEEEEHVLDDLAIIANEYDGYVFDRERVRRTLRRFPAALDNVTRLFGIKNMPVLTLPIPDVIPCSSVPCGCSDSAQHLLVEDVGTQSCALSKDMFVGADCCNASAGGGIDTTDALTYHPTYEHLQGLFQRYPAVSNFVVDGSLNGIPNEEPRPCSPSFGTAYDMLSLCNASAQAGDHFLDEIVSATPPSSQGGSWIVLGAQTNFSARRVVFATGGFGAHATAQERTQLGMAASAMRPTVHAYPGQTSRLLVTLAETQGWTMGPFGQWGLDHVDGVPTWFLWHHKATVATRDAASGAWRTVINEADTYNKRHRQWMAANATEGVYCYAMPGGTSLADALVAIAAADEGTKETEASAYLSAVAADAVPKRCNSASNRFWRNWPPTCAGFYYSPEIIPVVNKTECERRISSTDTVTCSVIDVGIIDTWYGPAVDEFGRIEDEPTAFAIGNAALPLLSPAYLSPGSTLANGALGGIVSGQAACADL